MYVFKKGELNKFNTINQDLKTIFSEYTVIENNIIGKNILRKGFHFATYELNLFSEIFTNKIVNLNSAEVFKHIKDNKKYITEIQTNIRNELYLYGNSNSWCGNIGYFISDDKIQLALITNNDILEKVKFHTDSIIDNDNHISLSSDDIERLCKNNMQAISVDKFRTRITRELIPGLKKAYSADIYFYDGDISGVFYMHIVSERTSVVSHHIYRCIYL